ncbi:MAG: AGE family epimerase/isomerase [Gloeobacteraceae cyanobacterium ES-bin-316]|nr:AGE family epimerase/isomerase [Ferruginibacter sp.]
MIEPGLLQQQLSGYKVEMHQELKNILQYWMSFTVDKEQGGFYGKINHADVIFKEAPKGSVLNSRVLWAFSAAYNLTRQDEYLLIAKRAYEYLMHQFVDETYGGVYWSVDFMGKPLDTKKQTYATAFALYALSEYYKCSQNPQVLEQALSLYQTILNKACDKRNGGYFEAFARDWAGLADNRLSAKDANEKKSMNTHLHVIEAFANLYNIWPRESLKKHIEQLLQLFSAYIINTKTQHLNLFFEEDWTVKSTAISYGHDIEAAWLLLEAAGIIKNENYITQFKKIAVQITEGVFGGLDEDGGLWYEFEPAGNHLTKEKHSWPQAEAMIGFLNAWQITGDEKYAQASFRSWEFTRQYIKDNNAGEWVWGIYEDYSVMNKEDKVGTWKCPYHNTRACIEIIKRIDEILK